jgi:hypothetical protein
MDLTDFINYCRHIFDDKFKGVVYDPFNLRKENIQLSCENNALDIMIVTSKEYYLRNIKRLKEDGVCILVLDENNKDHKDLKLKETFSYHRFYSDSKNIFFVGTNDTTRYIPDYISDYRIKFKQRKTVVIYIFHEINANVKFFIQHGIFRSEWIDFIFVCNGSHQLDVPEYVKYFNRENIGHDFGGWSHVIFKENLLYKYEYFVLVNSSVRGPFIPPWSPEKNWITIFTRFLDHKTKLIGTTLGIDEYLTHIQSMILVLDRVALEIGIKEGIFEENPIFREKREFVITKEIGLSQAIIKHGYKIRPIFSAYHNSEITAKSVLRSRVHHLNYWYYGTNLHPYEVIFIKDNHNINENRDIDLLTTNHNLQFDRTINPTVPKNFNWILYIRSYPILDEMFRSYEGAIKHWLNIGFYENQK